MQEYTMYFLVIKTAESRVGSVKTESVTFACKEKEYR